MRLHVLSLLNYVLGSNVTFQASISAICKQVLTPADEEHHINKHNFRVPFVCGCRNLGEALRRIREGAAMIRTKGEAGTGNVVEAVRHVRSVMSEIRSLRNMDDDEVLMVIGYSFILFRVFGSV